MTGITELENIYILPQNFKYINKYYECMFLNKNKELLTIQRPINIIKEIIQNNINSDIQNINNKTININYKCIYIGGLMEHYGHFLIETLARFWIFLNNNANKININDFKIIISRGQMSSKDFKKNQNSDLFNYICNCFNIDKQNIIYLDNDPLYVKKLYIPEKYIYLNTRKYNILHKEVFDKIINYTLSINKQNVEKYDKIFVYRGLKDNRIDLNIENKLVEIFKKYNFKIINPSKKTFTNDILSYNNCKIIAGVEGTNIHNILFCKKNTILIGIASNRRSHFDANQSNCNHITQSKNYWIKKEMYKDLSIFEEKLKSILLENNLL